MVSVLLTRPQTTSAMLAKELQRQGYSTVIEPLLTISPANAPRPNAKPDAVMITSANALTALEEDGENIDELLGLPCFCVGLRTAGKASAFGFRNVRHSANDGAELAKLIAASLAPQSALLHIAGTHTDSKAREALQASGFALAIWPVYDATPAEALSPQIIERFKKQELDAVLLFSPRTAETLQKLIAQHQLEACCEGMIAIGLSEAVTVRLGTLPWRRLLASPTPSEDAVIACLKDNLPL